MDPIRRATSALACLALATAAGCGGDGGALSKAEYREQGNALCREAIAEAEGVDPPRSPDEIPDYVDRLFEVSFGYSDEFDVLDPPDELSDAHEESMRLTEDSRELIDGLVERLRAAQNPQTALLREFRKLAETREFKRSQAVTRDLGLDDCLDIGAPGAAPEAT